MIELVAALQREIAQIAPDYVQDPAKCVFRIYRDIRFSENKTPYKTNVSASLKKQGLSKDGSAVFYFQVSPEETLIAAAAIHPGRTSCALCERHSLENQGEFQKLCSAPKLRASLGELQGAQLTRVPKGFAPNHPAEDLLRRKQFYFYKDLDPAIVTTPELFKQLSQALKAALPVMQFLNKPLLGLAKADDSRFLRDSLE